MDLVKRWLPILKKWKLDEADYETAAEMLEASATQWKADNWPMGKILNEELPKLEKHLKKNSCRPPTCSCEMRTILAKGCQCGGT